MRLGGDGTPCDKTFATIKIKGIVKDLIAMKVHAVLKVNVK